MNYCFNLDLGDRKGWRGPTVEEFASLFDTTQSVPALPSGHPFSNVQYSGYWSSTTYAGLPDRAWHVHMSGNVSQQLKSYALFVWPVRGGK